jgi:hypothetical protein
MCPAVLGRHGRGMVRPEKRGSATTTAAQESATVAKRLRA